MSADYPIKHDLKASVASGATATSYYSGGDTTKIQFTVQPTAAGSGDATSGTVAVHYRAINGLNFEPLLDPYGAAVVITLAASTSVTRRFELLAEAVRFTPTAVDGTWSVNTSWYR